MAKQINKGIDLIHDILAIDPKALKWGFAVVRGGQYRESTYPSEY